jgi:polyferredoxin
MKKSRADRIARIVRWVLLASVLVVSTLIGRFHSLNKAIPPVDSFCPFGGLESLYTVVTQGAFLKRVAMSSLILLGATAVLALVFRRVFCGRICPLGFLQELTAKLGRLIFRGRFKVHARWLTRLDKIARYLKYAVLVYFLVLTWLTGYLVIRPYDPWVAYHHLFSAELLTSYLVGFILLILSLAGSMFVERPFCKYLCPMGGFLGLVSKAGVFRIRRNRSSCTDCEACTRICPVGIRVHELDKVTTAECISCGECQTACPVENTLVESPLRSRFSLPPLAVTLIVLVLFGGIVTATTLTGDFIWNKNANLPPTLQRILNSPERIAGDNSLLEIVYAYRIPPQLFVQQFEGLAEEHFYVTLDEAGLDVENVRELVVMYLSLYGTDDSHSGGSCSE